MIKHLITLLQKWDVTGKHKRQIADGSVVTATCDVHSLVIVLEPCIRLGNSVVTFDVRREFKPYRDLLLLNSRTEARRAMVVALAGELDPIYAVPSIVLDLPHRGVAALVSGRWGSGIAT